MPTLPPPAPYWVAPFAALLAIIAAAALLAPEPWHSNRTKLAVCGVLALPVAGYYLGRHPHLLVGALEEYIGFVVLLSALYVIAGGVRVSGDLPATPATNTAVLGIGALLASLAGTTGASMLLIRPLLEINRARTRVTHTLVFFTFLVANIGGCLTPLGDPPLLLGYLAGVPFWWTLRLAPAWALSVAILLGVYFAWDTLASRREAPGRVAGSGVARGPLRLTGLLNALWLAGVMAAVGLLRAPWREGAIVLLGGLSLLTTPAGVRRANGFTTHPMVEVAVLFLGIFVTVVPALEILRARADALPVREAWQFFWATGLLSAVLDNAPTYLVFVALAQGPALPAEVLGMPDRILLAISLGAVFMGANTYIGNAPNFMVKAIAEEAGVRMPSFFGYMLYSGLVLIPLFGCITFLFFA
jgi:Na+/H+ antiporter NhaD/arsenite permease-like protein